MIKLTNAAKIVVAALLIFACSGSKSFYKKGKKLEENGLEQEAVQFYIESLQRKSSNANAIIALKKLGQQVLDKKYGEFYKNYTAERYHDAVYNYLDATSFQEQVQNVGVQLEAAAYYKDYYTEARDIYISQLYVRAEESLNTENFSQAEQLLTEIKKLDPTYKDVSELSDFAFVEPKYREALRAYDGKKFREAYYLFKSINDRAKSGYKESLDYQELSLESAQYTLAILPVDTKSGPTVFGAGIAGQIISAIKDLDDPFLRVLDRSVQAQIEEEQFRNLSANRGERTIIESGEYFGTKAILVGKVISGEQKSGRLIRNAKTGWQGKEVKYRDSETGKTRTRVDYHKVYYYEYTQENSASCSFQFQLLSTQSGEVLLSDVLTIEQKDAINYATFSGDTKYLVPGFWRSRNGKHPSDRIYNSSSQQRALQNKLKARREVESIHALTNKVVARIGQQVAKQIAEFNPE